MVIPPQWRVVALDEQDGETDEVGVKRHHEDAEDAWDLLEDADGFAPSSPGSATFAEIVREAVRDEAEQSGGQHEEAADEQGQ